jgi:hypothetical protein
LQEGFEPGHRETQTDWPEPLSRTGFWVIGLPAVALSWASLAVFILVGLFLQGSHRLRSLFVLPLLWGLSLAAVAAGLAWLILFQCRRRPGHPWPRAWALILAVADSAIVVIVGAFGDRSWAHAMAVAGLAASMALAPRFLRLHPDSTWVEGIAPLSLAGALGLVLLGGCWAGRWTSDRQEVRVEQVLGQARAWTAGVEEVTGSRWRLDDPASAQVEDRLAQIRKAVEQDHWLADPGLWRSAAGVEREGDLAQAEAKLIDAVAAGFSPQSVPQISSFSEPFAHVEGGKTWVASTGFPAASATIGSYHQDLGHLFADLEVKGDPAASKERNDLAAHYGKVRSQVHDNLEAEARQWANGWAVFRVPAEVAALGRTEVPLQELLQTPLTTEKSTADQPTLPPADVPQWMRLPLRELKAKARSQAFPGCRPYPYRFVRKVKGKDAIFSLYRLDCYSYAPLTKGLGAELRVEFRVVYESAPNRDLDDDQRPEEIYVTFPIPEGTDEGRFKEQVMVALAAAVHEVTGLEVEGVGSGHSLTDVFTITAGNQTFEVRPTETAVEFLPGRKAWAPRAYLLK